MSAAAGARRACLARAFCVLLCVLYLEGQDKHKCVWWPRGGRKAVGKAQRNCVVFWGLFIAGWFGTMGLLLSDSMGNHLAREL